jgi:hypothetical protein
LTFSYTRSYAQGSKWAGKRFSSQIINLGSEIRTVIYPPILSASVDDLIILPATALLSICNGCTRREQLAEQY